MRTNETTHVLHKSQDLVEECRKVKQLSQKNMFSKGDIDDRTGTLTLSNIETPRLASASATSCGVDTITAPGKT